MGQETNISLDQLYKSLQTFERLSVAAESRDKIYRYQDALMQSLWSILEDQECDEAAKMTCLSQTLEQYAAAMKELFPVLISNGVQKAEDPAPEDPPQEEPPEPKRTIGKSDPDRFDEIQEVEKFNPYHDRLGRFATADGFMNPGYSGDKQKQAVTFSADPKTKAGANAIARESDGETGHEIIGGAYGTKEPAKNPKQKPKIEPKKNLEDGLGKEHADALENLVDKAPQEVKDLWNKYGGEVKVGTSDLTRRGAHCDYNGNIHVNIEKDSQGSKFKPPYETTLHESAHSIDHAISKKAGFRFSTDYNDGEFQKTLVREVDTYIKGHQKKLSKETGQKVSIQSARDDLGRQFRKEGAIATGDVSDIFEGATKGKFIGSAGHGKSYWVGKNTYFGKIGGHDVAIEAFAEMFSASASNPASLTNIKKYLPESYKVFQTMIKEASSYE